jgi:hypothetical protein
MCATFAATSALWASLAFAGHKTAASTIKPPMSATACGFNQSRRSQRIKARPRASSTQAAMAYKLRKEAMVKNSRRFSFKCDRSVCSKKATWALAWVRVACAVPSARRGRILPFQYAIASAALRVHLKEK